MRNSGASTRPPGTGRTPWKIIRNTIGLAKEIYQSSPENLYYKNGLAISYEKLGECYLSEKDDLNALNSYEQSRALSLELWEATQGQIVSLAFTFAFDCWKITDIEKRLILAGEFDKKDTSQKIKRLKAMRLEGHNVLQPLAEAGKLNQDRLWLFNKLADETWYDF